MILLFRIKTNENREIPINGDLAELFKSIGKKDHLKSEYVFCNKNGKPRKGPKVSKSFNAFLRRAGIKDFRFHDLRHTFASHYLMRGLTLRGLQKILGHKDLKTTIRYAHLSKQFVQEEINLLDGLTNDGRHKTVTLKEASL